MALFWILALVVVLYIRTLNYTYVIDDCVRREGYMYDVPLTSPPAGFFNTKPSKLYRLFMIGMHCVNVSIIYMLWGWAPALLFAVHPLSVWGVAWVTGNYYATATYFTLIAYYIITTFPNIWGVMVAMPIFAAALNSTVCPMTFPFLFIFTLQPWGLSMFIPLAIFLRGRKFTTGIKIRRDINNDKVYREKSVKINYFRRIAVMTRITARYIFPCFYPDRLGFFDSYGRKLKERPEVYNAFHSFSLDFWVSFALCLTVFVGGLMISPVGTFWFFVFAALHSQFNLTGQFYAQRYLYLSSIGICIIVGTAVQPFPVIVAVIATFLVFRTHFFIHAFSSQEAIWRNDVDAFPHSSQSWNNLAQFYLQVDTNSYPVWRLNEVGYFLFRAEAIDPNSWEIQMNLACFFVRVGQLNEALARTDKSIELLKPLGGLPHPLEALKKQRPAIMAMIEKSNKEATNQGSAQTSLPNEQPKEGVNHDSKRNQEEETRITESNGDSGVTGREARCGCAN